MRYSKELRTFLKKKLGKPDRVKKVGNWEVRLWKRNGLSIVWDNEDRLAVTDLETHDFVWDEEEIRRRLK